MRRLAQLAERTPAGRERYVDLLRAVAIAMVVIGHWAVTVIGEDATGRPTGRSALPELPWAYPLTWAAQVMPVFFLVGGFANAASLTARRARGGDAAGWLLDRAARLLRPTTALLLVLTGGAAVASLAGADATLVRTVVWFATIPLWFLAAYLLVVPLTPAMYALHRRFGLLVPVALAVLVAAGDVGRTLGPAELAVPNYLFGWLAVHQLGFAWHDARTPPPAPAHDDSPGSRPEGPRHDVPAHDGPGQAGPGQDGPGQDGSRHDGPGQDGSRHDVPAHDGPGHAGPGHDGSRHDGRRGLRSRRLPMSRRAGGVALLGGLAATVLLTTVGPYPVAMLNVPGERLDNAAPPSLALLTLTVAQLGLILLLRGPAERWLHRPRPWQAVIAVNAVVLTVFLWHLTAAILLVGALDAAGLLPTPAAGSAAWLAWRLPWVLLLTVVLAVLVAVFGPVEAGTRATRPGRGTPAEQPRGAGRSAAVRGALAAVGFAAVVYALVGNAQTPRAAPEPLGVPVAALLAYLAGAGLLRLLRSAWGSRG
ncbi:acyltransferase family protein [Micromonospora coxensis]|uniref:Acyltransferase family protein n=1 Tax=Micromonospora coxensis TaxID=356852 RepID=A0A1C5HFQ7_9ACTN|nr:acyltransferase [Micromonospora coxensis]SCG44773.1 Acyltransferase family protein [Micromonospora coxensis]